MTVVLSSVEKVEGSNDKGPWKKYTLKDGNGQVIGSTFATALGDAAQALVGQTVDVDTTPPRDPKFPPTVTAIRPAKPSENGDGMTKEEWARKDSAIHKMACIKTAADALKHTLPSDPDIDALNRFNSDVLHLALGWHRSVLAERDDPTGEDIPFE